MMQRYLAMARSLEENKIWVFCTIALSEDQAFSDLRGYFFRETGKNFSEEYEFQIIPEEESLTDETARISFLMTWIHNGFGDTWDLAQIDLEKELKGIADFIASVNAETAESVAKKLFESIPDDALLN